MVEVECDSMDRIYSEKLNKIEKSRIEKIEIFDEFEEWTLLQSHYCICYGKRYSPEVSDKAKAVVLSSS